MKTNTSPEAATGQPKLAADQQPEVAGNSEGLARKEFINQSQLLEELPICARTARNWIAEGKLPAVKIGRRLLFHWPSVTAALLRQQRNTPVTVEA